MQDKETKQDLEPVYWYTDHFGRPKVMYRLEAEAIDRSGKWPHGTLLNVKSEPIEPQPLLCEKLLAMACRPCATLPGAFPSADACYQTTIRNRRTVIHWRSRKMHGIVAACGEKYLRFHDVRGVQNFSEMVGSDLACVACAAELQKWKDSAGAEYRDHVRPLNWTPRERKVLKELRG